MLALSDHSGSRVAASVRERVTVNWEPETKERAKRLKVLSIVGVRSQFIKATPVGKALRAAGHTEVLVHTGQHYDDELSAALGKSQGGL